MKRTYEYGVPERPHHTIYKKYLGQFNLNKDHDCDLRTRGLLPEQIREAGYVSKPISSASEAQRALGAMTGW